MELYTHKLTLPPYERLGAYIKGDGGVGELAPFPGVHLESLEEALEEIRRGECTLPSVAFALDMARTRLEGPRANFYQLILANEPLPEQPGPVKLKIGSDKKRDLERIQRLHALGCSIRLDANRKWTLEEALDFDIGNIPIEYIEEPLKNSSELSKLHRETGWPLALDETLYKGEPWQAIEGVCAFVLKPAALGPLERTYAFAREAQKLSYRVVISSCFESAVGIDFLARLAHHLAPDELAGLDTLRFYTTLQQGRCTKRTQH